MELDQSLNFQADVDLKVVIRAGGAKGLAHANNEQFRKLPYGSVLCRGDLSRFDQDVGLGGVQIVAAM